MIRDRELALDLANRWGTPRDMRYLMKLVSDKKVDYVDMNRVLQYWVRKVDAEKAIIAKGGYDLSKAKSTYPFCMVAVEILGGRPVEAEWL